MKGKTLVVGVVLLLCIGAAGWLVFKWWTGKIPNKPPIAAVRVDSLDETNRIATLSDGGSRDVDGNVQNWRIAWGDDKEDNFSSLPLKVRHTYGSEGDYRISLWCVDNLGATSSVPAMT